MPCLKYRKLISDQLDGKIDPKKEAKLKEHLFSCSACRDYQERLKMIQSVVASLPSPNPPVNYWQESMARIKQRLKVEQGKELLREKGLIFWLRRRPWVMALPVFLASAALIWYLSLAIKEKEPAIEYMASQVAAPAWLDQIELDPSDFQAFNEIIEAQIEGLTWEEMADVQVWEDHWLSLENLSAEEIELLMKELEGAELENGW